MLVTLNEVWKSVAYLSDWTTHFKYHSFGRQKICRYSNGAQTLNPQDSFHSQFDCFLSMINILRIHILSILTEWSSIKNSKNSRRLWSGPNWKVCENQLSVQWSGWRRPGDPPAIPGPSFQPNATEGGRSWGNPVGEFKLMLCFN